LDAVSELPFIQVGAGLSQYPAVPFRGIILTSENHHLGFDSIDTSEFEIAVVFHRREVRNTMVLGFSAMNWQQLMHQIVGFVSNGLMNLFFVRLLLEACKKN